MTAGLPPAHAAPWLCMQAMQEAAKHLAKSRATDREDQIAAMQEAANRISRFVQAQGLMAADPAAAVALCQNLLQEAPEQMVSACVVYCHRATRTFPAYTFLCPVCGCTCCVCSVGFYSLHTVAVFACCHLAGACARCSCRRCLCLVGRVVPGTGQPDAGSAAGGADADEARASRTVPQPRGVSSCATGNDRGQRREAQ